MNLLNKNFIIFSLMICIVGIFAFHWFFMAEIMPVSECMSTNCAYSSIQVITQEPIGVLLIILIIVLFAALLPFALWPDDKLKRALQRFFVKHRINVFCYKLISWLKILEKRDPQTALITVRIYNFEQ